MVYRSSTSASRAIPSPLMVTLPLRGMSLLTNLVLYHGVKKGARADIADKQPLSVHEVEVVARVVGVFVRRTITTTTQGLQLALSHCDLYMTITACKGPRLKDSRDDDIQRVAPDLQPRRGTVAAPQRWHGGGGGGIWGSNMLTSTKVILQRRK